MELEKLLENLNEGFESDESVASELKLFIDNDSDLYRQRTQPIMKNLARKIRKGIYDSDKAVKLWKYLADAGAKKYAQKMGGEEKGWHQMFPTVIRLMVAKELASQFESEVQAGGFDVDELAMREHQMYEISKEQLTEMVRKTIRRQLNESANPREWSLLDKIRDAGADDTSILEELMRSMSSQEAVENLEHIARMWDVNVDEEEEEEEENDDWYDDSMDGDHESGLASAGFGTDEDYGSFGGEDW